MISVAALIGLDLRLQLPLFLVIFAGILAGLAIGFVWEWVREMKHRTTASTKTREVRKLERELALLKDQTALPGDDVLALLDSPRGARMAGIRVKICGLRTVADVAAVALAGAGYMGLNFFPKSPRFVTLAQGRVLALAAPVGLAKVALVVDADDAALDAIIAAMPLDMLQLHGHETPERVAQVRARYGLPVMKVMGVADEGDLAGLLEMSLAADQVMIDA